MGMSNSKAQNAETFPKLWCHQCSLIRGKMAIESKIPVNGSVHNSPSPPPLIPWLLSAANRLIVGAKNNNMPKKNPLVISGVNNFMGLVPLCLGFNMSFVQRHR